MANIKRMISTLGRNHWVIMRHAEGITHEESMLCPPNYDNSFNWALGHVVASRDGMLRLLNAQPLADEAEFAVYHRESEPLSADAAVLPFERLVELADISQARLKEALGAAPPEWQQAFDGPDPNQNNGRWLDFLIWHETFHLGQLEIFRRLAGKMDKTI